jgi:Domain of unknown function (DUF4136)
MKTRITSMALVGAAMLLFTIPTLAQKVAVDWDHKADFSKYSTYAWAKGKGVAKNPINAARAVQAVETELASKGKQKVDSNPDMYVILHAIYDQQATFNTTGYGYGYGPYWRGGGGGLSTTTEYKYTIGTMIVDIYDAKTKQLIWRGSGSDTVSDKPEKNEKKIYKATQKMFQKFPPPPGK